MIGIALAASAAVAWGLSDYLGGHLTRSALPVFTVVVVSESVGLLVLIVVLMIHGVGLPDSPKLLLAAGAGVAVTIQISLLYTALARGNAFISAPIGAIGTAIPVAIALATGSPASAVVIAGLVCAIAGTGISSWGSPPDGPGSGAQSLLTMIGAGIAVGTVLTLLHLAGEVDPYWTTAIAHLAIVGSAIPAALVARTAGRRVVRPSHGRRRAYVWGTLIAIGCAGAGGDLAYTQGSRLASLGSVAAVSSMYPVVTIGLAWATHGRRPDAVRLLGIAVALAGAGLLAATAG